MGTLISPSLNSGIGVSMNTNGLACGSKRLEVSQFQILIAKYIFRFGSSFLSLLLGACLLFSPPVYSLSPVITEGSITVQFNVNENHLSDKSKVLLARQLPNIFSLDLQFILIRAIKAHTKPNARNVSNGVHVAQNRVDTVRQFFIEAGIDSRIIYVEVVQSVQDVMRTQASSSSDALSIVYVEYAGLCKKGYWGICKEIVGADGLSYSLKEMLATKKFHENLKSSAIHNLPCSPESSRLGQPDGAGDYPSFNERVAIASEIGKHPVVATYFSNYFSWTHSGFIDGCLSEENLKPSSMTVVANISADGEILKLDFEPKSDFVACIVKKFPRNVAPPPTCSNGILPVQVKRLFKINTE